MNEKWNIVLSSCCCISTEKELSDALNRFRTELQENQLLFLNNDDITRALDQLSCVHKRRRSNTKYTLSQYTTSITNNKAWPIVDQNFKKLLLLRSHIIECFHAQVSIRLFTDCINRFYLARERSLISPHDMVGVVAAQSISERFTQSTLNSFHLAGSQKSAAQQGIKRITEIFDASKKLQLPFLSPIKARNPDKLLHKTFESISIEYGIKWEPLPSETDQTKKKMSSWLIYFTLESREKYDFYFKNNSDYLPKWVEKTNITFDHTSNTVYIRTRGKSSPDIAHETLHRLLKLQIGGIKNATEYDSETQTLYFQPRTSIVASFGKTMDLTPLFEATDYELDLSKLRSNDIHFMCAIFGIEATRQHLLQEVKEVLAREGIRINVRHIMLLVDNMTYLGRIIANKYHGIDAGKSIIHKATIQQGTETFNIAATLGLVDNISDVSSQVMTGKLPQIGTACVDLTPDSDDKTDYIQRFHDQQAALRRQPMTPPAILTNPAFLVDHAMRYVPASPSSPAEELPPMHLTASQDDFLQPNLEF